MQKLAIQDVQTLIDVQSHDTTNTESTLATLGFTVTRTIPGSPDVTDYANFALITIEKHSIRFGKGTPTTSLGTLADPNDPIRLNSAEEIANVKFISAVADLHATLQAQVGFR